MQKKHLEIPYVAVVEQAGDAFFVRDREGAILDVNPRACEMLGYKRSELLSMSISDLTPTGCPSDADEAWGKVLAGVLCTFECSLQRKDHTTVPVEVTFSALKLPDRLLFLGIARDVSSRHEKYHAYGQLIDGMTDAALVVGLDGRILVVNERTSELLGYSRHELLSMSPVDFDCGLDPSAIKVIDR